MTVKNRKLVAGFTLVELVTAILIVAIVVAGGSLLFVTGKGQVNLQKHYRAATHLASQRLEELKAGPYASIGNESNSISLDDMTYTRDVNVTTPGSYKQVTVNVHWQQGHLTRNVSLVTLVAP